MGEDSAFPGWRSGRMRADMWSELEIVREEDFAERSQAIAREAAIAWNPGLLAVLFW